MINLDVFPHFITLAPPKSQSTFDCIVACSYKMHFLELAFAIMKFLLHCKKNCCSFIGLTTLIVGMTINISLRQATEKIDNS